MRVSGGCGEHFAGGWEIFAGESTYVLDPPYRRAKTIYFLYEKEDYEGLRRVGYFCQRVDRRLRSTLETPNH